MTAKVLEKPAGSTAPVPMTWMAGELSRAYHFALHAHISLTRHGKPRLTTAHISRAFYHPMVLCLPPLS